MYKLEEHLVNNSVSHLVRTSFAEWAHLKVTTEFDYKRGRADIVALTQDNKIIAFEAKLKKWREALHQAYRNTCFAHYSFTLLPEETANQAIRYIAEFSRRSVGICYLTDSGIVLAHPAPYTTPIQKWLSEIVTNTILESNLNGHLYQVKPDRLRSLRTQEFCLFEESG